MTDRQIIEAAVTLLPLLHDLLGSRAPDVIRRLSYWLDPGRVTTEEADREMLAILTEHPESRQWLREYLPEAKETQKMLQPAAPRGAPAAPPRYPETPPQKHEVVRIFFATDRAISDATEPRRVFGGGRAPDGTLRLGTCNVSIPATHTKGKLEKPAWFLRNIWADPGRHIVLLRVEVLAGQDFFATLRQGSKEALLFIHGYNVTFEDAARRTAQLAWDLKYSGAPVLYSWPSRGSPASYFADESSVEWTAEHLKSFLCDLAKHGEFSDLHVIAHSMGNRALARALELLALEASSVTHIQEVILTALDIDSGVFRQPGGEYHQGAATDHNVRFAR